MNTAPASVLTITDVAGDLAGTATFANAGVGDQLITLDLRDAAFDGTNITTIC